ncbi:MAG: hypothetical protein OCD01_18135 [Fibrobacterales bacterium]
MKVLKITTALLMLFMLIACGGSKPDAEPEPTDPYGKMLLEKKKLSAEGILSEVATAESRDLETAYNKVELAARAKIGRTLESKTSSMQKEFKEEVGEEFIDAFTQVTKSISSRVLNGSTLIKTIKEEKGGKYIVTGLMVLDPSIVKAAFEAELQANEAMKTRFMASKGYAELSKEVEAFEAYKKDMTP